MEGTKPLKEEIKRDAKGRIVAGSASLHPAGRPKGKTLKEFAREMLMSMSDEEKLAYLKQLPPEIVWRMSEGNPHTTTDVTSDGEKLPSGVLSIQYVLPHENPTNGEATPRVDGA